MTNNSLFDKKFSFFTNSYLFDQIVKWSKKIITAHAEAAQDGKGIVVVDGKLIENLHVLNAERLVTMAQAIEEMENA